MSASLKFLLRGRDGSGGDCSGGDGVGGDGLVLMVMGAE